MVGESRPAIRISLGGTAFSREQLEHALVLRLGLNLNDAQNGVPLSEGRAGTMSPHKGPHPGYNVAFKSFLDRIENMTVSDNQKREWLAETIERMRQALFSGLPQIMLRNGGTPEAWNVFFERLGNDLQII